jgi:hypothetical protein
MGGHRAAKIGRQMIRPFLENRFIPWTPPVFRIVPSDHIKKYILQEDCSPVCYGTARPHSCMLSHPMATIPIFAIRHVQEPVNARSPRARRPPPELIATGTIRVNPDVMTSPSGAARLIADHHRSIGEALFFIVIDPSGTPACLCTIDPALIAHDIFSGFARLLGRGHHASIIAVEHGGSGGIMGRHIEYIQVLTVATVTAGACLLDYILVRNDGSITSLAIERKGIGLAVIASATNHHILSSCDDG